uniref:uncharacterized protein LOC128928122 isoform X3 n=1 Tax=Callithrix jacchus TaxID=9483 RepID=UPI0023DD1B42|nr:uncharacterized protein LOC128928122 isoform X3 [Callithrix jacchus]
MGNFLGPRAGLICAWCREAVASCCGTQSVAATPPESTTAEPDFVYAGVVEVQHVQPKSKRRKGLAGRVRSWVQKRRRKKICPTANEAPLQDQKKTLKRRENLKETSPDIEKHVTQYCHRAVQVPQDLSLEHIKDDELPRDVEKPAVSCHRRPVEVPQDLILEDIEDEELPRDEEKRAIWCHRRPLEIILEDDEDEDLPRDVDTVTAPNDLPPPEDCRSPKCEEDGEGSSLAVDVSSSDLASTVGLRSQTEEEDLDVRLLCLLKKFRFCDFFSINLDMKI